MYEEIVESSRFCAMGYNGACDGCIFCGKSNDKDGDCYQQLHKAAANAIEEDDIAFRQLERDYKVLCGNLPKWIPVTERLPKEGEFVLVCNDDKHMMIAKYETETYEWYYKYTNYDFDIWDNEEQGPVCYWMPLPEPPKEE